MTTLAGRPVTNAQVRGTIALLSYYRRFLASGFGACVDPQGTYFQATLTRDEARSRLSDILDLAIDRRAGWPEDPHARDIAPPVNGRLPRFATGDAQRHLCQLAHSVNSRARIHRSELGEWGRYFDRYLPDRFARPGDE